MNLLLIEDNPADARLLREMLKGLPGGTFVLQQVARLDAALERLRQESFDVVLLDLGLPDSQGLQTLTLAAEANRALPIVVLTGLDDERLALEAVRAGAQDYLVKGRFDRELFVRTIRYAVERKRAEEEVRRLNTELERRVAERTAQLLAANNELLKEITERKRAAEALRDTEEQFRTLANAIPQLCWMANPDGWIFWYNQRWYSYTGTTPEQMEGWGWQAVHDPKILPKVLERWKVSIATGEPFDMVFPLRGADGIFRPFLTRVVPVKDADAKVVRWFGTNTDVTEQRQAEEALRQSNARLELAVDVADLGEWELDLRSHTALRSLRHDQIFGYKSLVPRWTYEMFLDHVLPEDRAQVDESFKASLASGTWNFEARIRRTDGAVRWIWARGRVREDEAGRPARMFGTVTDITERKQTEQSLLRSERLASAGHMAAAIAHEINNPLEAVTNVLFLAKGIKKLPGLARHYLEMADTELKRIAHLTRQSLGFYRESNAPALTSVNEVLESAVDLLNSRIKAKHALIEKQWKGVVEVNAVGGELRQVFSNLLANSLDAIDEKGTIKVRVSTGAAFKNGHLFVRVTIGDNGKGIGPSSRPHMFEPFFTTKGTVGTGLGLWVSKQIIDKHGGTIRMRSSSNGVRKGTVFSVVLPVEPLPAARSQSAAC